MTEPNSQSGQDFPLSQYGRDEMNLAEFPIAMTADRVPNGQKTLCYEDKHGRLTVTGSDAYGLPTANDTDVIVALIYLTKIRNEFSDVKVNFSRYELIKLMGWQDEGGSYKRLDQSFNRWSGVLLVYDKCWWNNKLKRYTDAKMHIIDNVEIIDNDARRKAHLEGQGGLPLSYFTWNRKFLESCQADNLRQLDLDIYFSLKSAVSKRLYRFLGKRFYVQGDWTFDLHEVAFDRVGLSRSYEKNAGKVKEKLQAAIDELEAIGFLKPYSRDERYTRVDRGQWKVRFTKYSASPNPAPSLPPASVEAREPQESGSVGQLDISPLVAALTQRGVSAKAADALVQQFPSAFIEGKIEEFDWEMTQPKPPKKPAGYLVKSIREGYATDPDFISTAQRQRQEDARQEKERQAAEVRRRKQMTEQNERRLAEKVKLYQQSQTPEQLAQLELVAIEQASEEARRNLANPDMKLFRKTLISGLLKEHIARLIEAEEKLTEPA